MRIVEPELPQSSRRSGSVKWPLTPVISTASLSRVTFAARASTQAREEAQSAPVEKLVRRVVPSANPPSNA